MKTMDTLNDDCIERMLCILDAKSRLRFSLVCKAWQRLESRRPWRPASLRLSSDDVDSKFLAWILRDTSRLQAITLLPAIWDEHEAEACWQCLDKLLVHLIQAPALRRMVFNMPSSYRMSSPGPSMAGHHDPNPFADLIPRIASLSRLERLALKAWHCEDQEVVLIAHLSRLQHLEVLELQYIFFQGHRTEVGVRRAAALLLQLTLKSLPRLTSLDMDHVDLLDHRCSEAVQPDKMVDSLTRLRSLAYGADYRQRQLLGTEIRVRYPALRELVNLTSLSLCCYAPAGVPVELLTSLHSLTELSIDNGLGPQFPVLLSPSARVTKLEMITTMNRKDVNRLNGILPLASLRYVEELAIHCKNETRAPEEWPGDWGWLTGLTKLSFHFQSCSRDGFGLGDYVPQEFFTAVKGLRDLEVTSKFDLFDNHGQEYLLFLADRLAGLTRLQVNLVSVENGVVATRFMHPAVPGHPAGEEMTALERAQQICQEVRQRVPGMTFAVEKVGYNLKCSGWVKLCLIITLIR